MTLTKKFKFYSTLWFQYLFENFLEPRYSVISEISDLGRLRESANRLRIYFYISSNSAGAEQIVKEIIRPLQDVISLKNLKLEVVLGSNPIEEHIDILLVFKGPRIDTSLMKCAPLRQGLIICDQGDMFWDELPKFDFVVSTSSLEFSRLVAWRASNVFYIPEFEPDRLIDVGRRRLSDARNELNNLKGILWHGGKYSQKELELIIPLISRFNRGVNEKIEIWIVSGDERSRAEVMQGITVNYRPWSEGNLINASQKCRLALIPARSSLKNSYLKPASRIRRVFALGLFAVGDSRVPEVRRFAEKSGVVTLDFFNLTENELEALWTDAGFLQSGANAGHICVRKNYSPTQTVLRWLELFDRLIG